MYMFLVLSHTNCYFVHKVLTLEFSNGLAMPQFPIPTTISQKYENGVKQYSHNFLNHLLLYFMRKNRTTTTEPLNFQEVWRHSERKRDLVSPLGACMDILYYLSPACQGFSTTRIMMLNFSVPHEVVVVSFPELKVNNMSLREG